MARDAIFAGDFNDGMSVNTSTMTYDLVNITLNDAAYGTDMDATTTYFYSTGGTTHITFNCVADDADAGR